MLKIMIIVITFGALGGCSSSQNPEPSANYCQMVGLYAESGGDYGWPDYKKMGSFCP